MKGVRANVHSHQIAQVVHKVLKAERILPAPQHRAWSKTRDRSVGSDSLVSMFIQRSDDTWQDWVLDSHEACMADISRRGQSEMTLGEYLTNEKTSDFEGAYVHRMKHPLLCICRVDLLDTWLRLDIWDERNGMFSNRQLICPLDVQGGCHGIIKPTSINAKKNLAKFNAGQEVINMVTSSDRNYLAVRMKDDGMVLWDLKRTRPVDRVKSLFQQKVLNLGKST